MYFKKLPFAINIESEEICAIKLFDTMSIFFYYDGKPSTKDNAVIGSTDARTISHNANLERIASTGLFIGDNDLHIDFSKGRYSTAIINEDFEKQMKLWGLVKGSIEDITHNKFSPNF